MPSEASPLELPPSPGSAAILVVDEDPAFQLGLKTFLREYVGFSEVFTARNGREALELIENEESIELVTLDYQMPVMNGIEVMHELSQSAPRPLSVTMITGYPSDELEDEFRSFASSRLLTDYFLPKPVEFEKLEPLMLRAHEELEKSKRDLEAEAMTPVPEEETSPGDTASPIAEQISRQNEKLEKIEQKVDALRKDWRTDFWRLALLAGLIWAALHFGWVEKLEPAWERIKADAAKHFQPGDKPETGEAAPAPAAAKQEAPKAAQEKEAKPEAPSSVPSPSKPAAEEEENTGRPL